MQGEFDEHSVWKALEIAMACTTSTSQHRVTMDVVLSELKNCLEMCLGIEKELQHQQKNFTLRLGHIIIVHLKVSPCIQIPQMLIP
ncbi:hypothetical protein C1H46_033274 [Malus baccata]|uniref:Serine-threonine/tyrosine-protein kinase catalytic domain-containing protein n=1 Tax=Malus baccata TaxID=106549 RepID=A0A540L3X1_MALBA|nr:hypothetical protein C1H46_033274 [Malus baccata]